MEKEIKRINSILKKVDYERVQIGSHEVYLETEDKNEVKLTVNYIYQDTVRTLFNELVEGKREYIPLNSMPIIRLIKLDENTFAFELKAKNYDFHYVISLEDTLRYIKCIEYNIRYCTDIKCSFKKIFENEYNYSILLEDENTNKEVIVNLNVRTLENLISSIENVKNGEENKAYFGNAMRDTIFFMDGKILVIQSEITSCVVDFCFLNQENVEKLIEGIKDLIKSKMPQVVEFNGIEVVIRKIREDNYWSFIKDTNNVASGSTKGEALGELILRNPSLFNIKIINQR